MSEEQKQCECIENCLKHLCATYCTCKKHGQPKQRSYFDLPDKEKKEIMDNAAKASNDAQQEIIRKAEQKACECKCVCNEVRMPRGTTVQVECEHCKPMGQFRDVTKELAPSLNNWEESHLNFCKVPKECTCFSKEWNNILNQKITLAIQKERDDNRDPQIETKRLLEGFEGGKLAERKRITEGV